MKVIRGNLLDVKDGIICHQVNCKGVMGAGIALKIRKKHSFAYTAYMKAYRDGDLRLGNVIWAMRGKIVVANLCGQNGYGRRGQYTNYDALRSCFKKVKLAVDMMPPLRDKTVYVPKGMGCTLAGGSWAVVRQIIEEELPEAVIVNYN